MPNTGLQKAFLSVLIIANNLLINAKFVSLFFLMQLLSNWREERTLNPYSFMFVIRNGVDPLPLPWRMGSLADGASKPQPSNYVVGASGLTTPF